MNKKKDIRSERIKELGIQIFAEPDALVITEDGECGDVVLYVDKKHTEKFIKTIQGMLAQYDWTNARLAAPVHPLLPYTDYIKE